MEKFFDRTNEKVCADLAKHPNTPPEILEQLAVSFAKVVRLAVIQRSDITEKMLERSAEKTFDFIGEYNVDDHDLLVEIAKHPLTPVHLLNILATKQLSMFEVNGGLFYSRDLMKPFRLIARRRLKAMD